jgi:hypothetical protein
MIIEQKLPENVEKIYLAAADGVPDDHWAVSGDTRSAVAKDPLLDEAKTAVDSFSNLTRYDEAAVPGLQYYQAGLQSFGDFDNAIDGLNQTFFGDQEESPELADSRRQMANLFEDYKNTYKLDETLIAEVMKRNLTGQNFLMGDKAKINDDAVRTILTNLSQPEKRAIYESQRRSYERDQETVTAFEDDLSRARKRLELAVENSDQKSIDTHRATIETLIKEFRETTGTTVPPEEIEAATAALTAASSGTPQAGTLEKSQQTQGPAVPSLPPTAEEMLRNSQREAEENYRKYYAPVGNEQPGDAMKMFWERFMRELGGDTAIENYLNGK